MKKNIYVAIILLVIVATFIYVITYIKSSAVIDNPVASQAPVEKQVPMPVKQEDTVEEVKKIMNDNVTGVVEKIDGNVIVIKAEDGTLSEMPIAEGKTFVISQANNTMEGKQISDIKVGMKAFVHYEKETNLATTITLL